MKTTRRTFIKATGTASIGIMGTGLSACNKKNSILHKDIWKAANIKHTQHFNMCGFAAPRIETVRIGIIGIGSRGIGALHRLKLIEGTEIKAVCDKIPDRAEKAKKIITEYGLQSPQTYSGSEEIWKEMCQRPDLDIIYILTRPHETHTPMSLFAMKAGKHVAVEVPAAVTLDECWQLVETSEKTKKHCMMLENCCYDFFELLTLNMARQGFFGEIIHCEGAYIHHQPESAKIRPLTEYEKELRIFAQNNLRTGNTYPTHGLGPICQIMNINRGDKLNYLTSMSCDDFIVNKRYAEFAVKDPFYKQFESNKQNGNVNTSIIKTAKGKTIIVQLSTSPPRVYSRIHLISGTKGSALKYPEPGKISQGTNWFSQDEMEEIKKKYTPEIIKRVGDMAKKIGGHGGMDFIMDWRLIDCLRNGIPLEQDVYDAALWSSIQPLSRWSIDNRSNSIDVPDFTCGSYKTNYQLDTTLSQGGNTGVRVIKNDDKSNQLNV